MPKKSNIVGHKEHYWGIMLLWEKGTVPYFDFNGGEGGTRVEVFLFRTQMDAEAHAAKWCQGLNYRIVRTKVESVVSAGPAKMKKLRLAKVPNGET